MERWREGEGGGGGRGAEKKVKCMLTCAPTVGLETDNVFAIRTWCKRKFNIDLSVLDKTFGIPADLDYVE